MNTARPTGTTGYEKIASALLSTRLGARDRFPPSQMFGTSACRMVAGRVGPVTWPHPLPHECTT